MSPRPPAGRANGTRHEQSPTCRCPARCSRRPSACPSCRSTRERARRARAARRTCRTDSCRAGRLFTVNGNFARSSSERRSSGCTPAASKAARDSERRSRTRAAATTAGAATATRAARRGSRFRWARVSWHQLWHHSWPPSSMRAAAKQRDAFALLVAHRHVVDAGAPRARALLGGRGQLVAEPRGQQELDARARMRP